MNNKILKTKKAFSLIELIIVIAIVVIMTAVLFVNRNSGKASSDVQNASRQVAAQIRALQNEALNGKQFDTNNDGNADANACFYEFIVENPVLTRYKLTYFDCAMPTPVQINTANVDLKRVTFSGEGSLFFVPPHGTVDGGVLKKFELQSLIDPSVRGCVLVSPAGIVMEQKNACP